MKRINWEKAEAASRKPLWNPGTENEQLVGYEGQIIFTGAIRELTGPSGPFQVVDVARTNGNGEVEDVTMSLSKNGLKTKVEALFQKAESPIGKKYVLGVANKRIANPKTGRSYAPVVLMTEEEALKAAIFSDTKSE